MKKVIYDNCNIHGVEISFPDMVKNPEEWTKLYLEKIHQRNSAIDLKWAELEIRTRYKQWLKQPL